MKNNTFLKNAMFQNILEMRMLFKVLLLILHIEYLKYGKTRFIIFL